MKLILLLVIVVVAGALDSGRKGPDRGTDTKKKSTEKTAGLPRKWKHCRYTNNSTGQVQAMIPGDVIIDENCRTHFCRVTGVITSSSENRTCSNGGWQGQCFGKFGSNLEEGQIQNQTTSTRNGTICKKCVCIDGKLECEQRACCTYADADGKTVIKYPGQSFHDGCKKCLCNKKTHLAECHLTECPLLCSFHNWEGAKGYANPGQENIQVLAKTRGLFYLPGKICEKLCTCSENIYNTENGGKKNNIYTNLGFRPLCLLEGEGEDPNSCVPVIVFCL